MWSLVVGIKVTISVSEDSKVSGLRNQVSSDSLHERRIIPISFTYV